MIKLLSTVRDAKTGKEIKKGETIDLGNERNEGAVKNGLAEWVKQSEKKEGTPAKTTSSAKGKPVETKAKK